MALSPPPADPVEQLVARDPAQRLREARYRFGQSLVFGLPVLALEFFGRGLGGVESHRWVGLFQALLSGWVVYVGATGPVFEGAALLLSRRRQVTLDLLVGGAAVIVYLISAVQVVRMLLGSPPHQTWFPVPVLLVGGWAALNWWRRRYDGSR